MKRVSKQGHTSVDDPHQDCLDPESGLYHLHHFKAALRLELARIDRWERPLSLLMIDLPGLDSPSRWDRAGRALMNSLRSIDQGARLDFKRLAAILPDADELRARRVMAEFSAAVKRDAELCGLRPTFGLALARPWEGVGVEALLDKALKNSGHESLELDEASPKCPSPSTAIAAAERDLLFDGFKLL